MNHSQYMASRLGLISIHLAPIFRRAKKIPVQADLAPAGRSFLARRMESRAAN